MTAVAEQQFVYRFGKREYDLSGRTHLMGILNVTPDSFSDGGRFLARDAAIEHALRMVEEGADRASWTPAVYGGEKFRRGLYATFPSETKFAQGDTVICRTAVFYLI